MERQHRVLVSGRPALSIRHLNTHCLDLPAQVLTFALFVAVVVLLGSDRTPTDIAARDHLRRRPESVSLGLKR
jgi:hypothetical protein